MTTFTKHISIGSNSGVLQSAYVTLPDNSTLYAINFAINRPTTTNVGYAAAFIGDAVTAVQTGSKVAAEGHLGVCYANAVGGSTNQGSFGQFLTFPPGIIFGTRGRIRIDAYGDNTGIVAEVTLFLASK